MEKMLSIFNALSTRAERFKLYEELSDELGFYGREWPTAAVGTGTIYFNRTGRKNHFRVGCASRHSSVGEGYGISNGGFAEIKPMLMSALRTIFMMTAEAYREKTEEIPGIEAIIPKDLYQRNAQPLVQLMVRTPDSNKVHACNFFGYEVFDAEIQAIQKLPKSSETTRPLEFFDMFWDVDLNGRYVEGSVKIDTPAPFYHPHEWAAFEALARLETDNRLWPRLAA